MLENGESNPWKRGYLAAKYPLGNVPTRDLSRDCSSCGAWWWLVHGARRTSQ